MFYNTDVGYTIPYSCAPLVRAMPFTTACSHYMLHLMIGTAQYKVHHYVIDCDKMLTWRPCNKVTTILKHYTISCTFLVIEKYISSTICTFYVSMHQQTIGFLHLLVRLLHLLGTLAIHTYFICALDHKFVRYLYCTKRHTR